MFKRVLSSALALCLVFGTAVVLPENAVSFGRSIVVSAEWSGDYRYTVLDDGTVKITTYIGEEATVSIPSVINSKKVTIIGEEAFNGCKNIKNITIPNTVKTIESWAFEGCTNLTGLTIPDSVTSIGLGTFSDCKSLKSVTIPDSVKTIEPWAFVDCSSLTNITLPESVTSIGKNAFQGCTGLISINIPSKVTSIEEYAFDYCESLTGITIPNGVTSIDRYAFRYCKKLRSITVPSSVKSIGVYAFYYDPGINDVYYTGTATQWKSIDVADRNDFLLCANIHYNSTASKFPTVTCTAGTNSLSLKWSTISNAENYAVCGYVNGAWKILAKTKSTSYTLNNLKAGTRYSLAVIAMFNKEWYMDFSKAFTAKTNPAETHAYPTVTSIDYNKQYHQFRLNWASVPNAQNYGIAVYYAGKWNIQTQSIPATTTSYTSPKLTPGRTYDLLIAAKVGGKWDLTNMNGRVVSVTVM